MKWMPRLLPRRLILAATAALPVAGCGANFVPYETRPRASLSDPAAAPLYVGVCYNALFSTPKQVYDVASDACGVEGTPRLVGQDMRLACPLLTPTRATFACGAP